MKQLSSENELFEITGKLLKEKGRLVVAIDGRCGSGKTTLGKKLAERFGGNLISADDFFLQGFQRTAKRLAEIGGNLDRERLISEVLEPLSRCEDFSYRPFVCHSMCLGKAVEIKDNLFTVVEGSYSCHPDMIKYYDMTVFMSVDSRTQFERIAKRNGVAFLEAFKEKWIPLEEKYFEAFGIAEASDYFFTYSM